MREGRVVVNTEMTAVFCISVLPFKFRPTQLLNQETMNTTPPVALLMVVRLSSFFFSIAKPEAFYT